MLNCCGRLSKYPAVQYTDIFVSSKWCCEHTATMPTTLRYSKIHLHMQSSLLWNAKYDGCLRWPIPCNAMTSQQTLVSHVFKYLTMPGRPPPEEILTVLSWASFALSLLIFWLLNLVHLGQLNVPQYVSNGQPNTYFFSKAQLLMRCYNSPR